MPATVRALGSHHRYIPPKRYTWQSDVETVHRLVEDEFFDRETFTGPADFWAKLTTYWHYFNLVRPNRGKEWQSPLQILQNRAPTLATAVLNWRPLNLTKRHHLYLPKPNHRGHDLPSFPSKKRGGQPLSNGSGHCCQRMNAKQAIGRLRDVVRRQPQAPGTESTWVFWLRRDRLAVPG